MATWLYNSQPLLIALLVLQAADFVTGVMIGWARREISSSRSFRGVTRKASMWLFVAVCYAMQRLVPHMPIGDGAVLLYIGVEGLSLVENAALLGLPLPSGLVEALEKLRSKHEPSSYRAAQEARLSNSEIHIKSDSVKVSRRDTDQYPTIDEG